MPSRAPANRTRGALVLFVFLGAVSAGFSLFCQGQPRGGARGPGEGGRGSLLPALYNVSAGRSAGQVSTMILPQVHLRKPCYDFSFL